MVPSVPARKGHFPLHCTVTEIDDGKEALDALEQRKFDAMVTDVRMPRVTASNWCARCTSPAALLRQLFSSAASSI
jgi:CheY-like chemotaxis protein